MQRLSDTGQKYTAEQLRAMSDDDLSDCAARAVMKWGIVANSNVRPPFKRYFGLQSDEGGDAVDWQFASDDGAAFALVDRLKESYSDMRFRLASESIEGTQWLAMIDWWEGSVHRVVSPAHPTSRSRAITECCILAAQEVPRA